MRMLTLGLLSRYHSLPTVAMAPIRSFTKKNHNVPTMPSKNGQKEASRDRAWAEINLEHVRHNAAELQWLLPSKSKIMAVVKANAYGHGSTEVAKCLNQQGINHFAVAEIGEGIRLRKQGVLGEILILGYTSPELASGLAKYRLTQTLVSREYGEALEAYNVHLNVHIKIDTGMNRLGEPYQELESIMKCYQFPHLHVTGTFSHLSMSDSLSQAESDFTQLQLQHFDEVIGQLKAAKFDPGQVHIQSSYGILNYPEVRYDLVRPGIALYGLLSHEGDEVRAHADLRPVLSLKATVTQVKEVGAHHPVGYGYNFLPSHDIRIATVSIGYADGIPRSLSDHGGYVLIRGQRASIIGSICMDQLTVDVTSIDGVQQGDTVTIIGQDGRETITASQIAGRCGTVTNEILSRLGSRVERVYTGQ
ncbi:serine racemase VanT catalytic subunit [Paenibacillus dokdonensis]|uniref:Alanine racemase n=1 Tax=Paenibacillus dokdonensis TaxID=2567944 RepID=A0ABU6GNB0_9BACL|nr:serine racemase VanT catalytic subunit [Paenibacillus dokdonensis]MEC0241218.1 serine racemase VanT catalytic subunit [Paenibacillus dokdonensis]